MDLSRLSSLISRTPIPSKAREQNSPSLTNDGKPAAGRWRYLQPRDLRRLRNFQFAAKLIVEGYFLGHHLSPFHDFSAEFVDYRAYVPGDDLRTVDWRAYARTDRYYVKLFRKDTDMNCSILLDNSKSMNYAGSGGITKLEYANYMAAALSYLITRQGDKASLAIGDNNLRKYIAPGSSIQHLQQILSTLEQNTIGDTTGLANTLKTLFTILKRRGLLIVISDFLDNPDEIFSALSMFAHRGFTILLFQVLTDDELHLPDIENALFLDMESTDKILVEPDLVRAAYESEIQKFIDNISGQAKARRIFHHVTTTSTFYYNALEAYLTTRTSVKS